MYASRSKILLVGAALLLLLSSCGEDDPTLPAGSPSQDETSPAPSPSQSEPGDRQYVTYEVWFASGDRLFVTSRTEEATPRVGSAAVQALLAGPTDAEADAEVSTAVPDGTDLNDLVIEDGIATADLSSEFESGGGSLSVTMRLAQLVFTLTQFPTVDGVLLEIDGRRVETFSGEGYVIDHPLERKDFGELLPNIVVTRPSVGDTVASPFTVTGTANVFEATVSYRLLDDHGVELVSGFTTATCGTGCRGDYSFDVKYEISADMQGTLEVFQSSAEDGSALDVVSVPLTLKP